MMVSSAEAGPQLEPSGKALICKKILTCSMRACQKRCLLCTDTKQGESGYKIDVIKCKVQCDFRGLLLEIKNR